MKLRTPMTRLRTCSGALGVAWQSRSALRIAYSTACRRARSSPTLGRSCPPLYPKVLASALFPLRSLEVVRDYRTRIGQPSVAETRTVSRRSHRLYSHQNLHRASSRLLYQHSGVPLVRHTGVSLLPLISREAQSSRLLRALHRRPRHRVQGKPLLVRSLLRAVHLYRVLGALVDVPGDVVLIALSIACRLSWTRIYRWSCDDA